MITKKEPGIPTLLAVPTKAYKEDTTGECCMLVRVLCPFCGKKNGHGIHAEKFATGRGKTHIEHRTSPCSCFPKGYYLQLPTRTEIKEATVAVAKLKDFVAEEASW